TDARRIEDGVLLGVAAPDIFGACDARMALLEVIANAAWQAVETGRAHFIVRPDNDGADAPPFLDAPVRQMMRQQHEAFIPFLIAQCHPHKNRMWSMGPPGFGVTTIAKRREYQQTAGRGNQFGFAGPSAAAAAGAVAGAAGRTLPPVKRSITERN